MRVFSGSTIFSRDGTICGGSTQAHVSREYTIPACAVPSMFINRRLDGSCVYSIGRMEVMHCVQISWTRQEYLFMTPGVVLEIAIGIKKMWRNVIRSLPCIRSTNGLEITRCARKKSDENFVTMIQWLESGNIQFRVRTMLAESMSVDKGSTPRVDSANTAVSVGTEPGVTPRKGPAVRTENVGVGVVPSAAEAVVVRTDTELVAEACTEVEENGVARMDAEVKAGGVTVVVA